MITQFYIIEIQQYLNGQFGHIIHFAYDTDPKKAQLKAEAKYHEVLAAAAVSELPSHSATIIASNGAPVAYQCYTHEVQPEPIESEVQTQSESGLEEQSIE